MYPVIIQHATCIYGQTSQTALGLSLRSWWFVWREGKNAGKTRTKFFVTSGADPGIFDWGGGGRDPNLGQKGSHQSQLHVIIPWPLPRYIKKNQPVKK